MKLHLLLLTIMMIFTCGCTDSERIDRRAFGDQGAQDANSFPEDETGESVSGDPVGEPGSSATGAGEEPPVVEPEVEETRPPLGEVTDETFSTEESITFAAASVSASHMETEFTANYSINISEVAAQNIKEYQCADCEGDNDPACEITDCSLDENAEHDACFCTNPDNSANERCVVVEIGTIRI